jgi:hypothetical protein
LFDRKEEYGDVAGPWKPKLTEAYHRTVPMTWLYGGGVTNQQSQQIGFICLAGSGKKRRLWVLNYFIIHPLPLDCLL